MKINGKKEVNFGREAASKKASTVFEVFKNDLVSEWIFDKKDITELDEGWMSEVSGKGSKGGRVIPLSFDSYNSPDDDFLFVA